MLQHLTPSGEQVSLALATLLTPLDGKATYYFNEWGESLSTTKVHIMELNVTRAYQLQLSREEFEWLHSYTLTPHPDESSLDKTMRENLYNALTVERN